MTEKNVHLGKKRVCSVCQSQDIYKETYKTYNFQTYLEIFSTVTLLDKIELALYPEHELTAKELAETIAKHSHEDKEMLRRNIWQLSKRLDHAGRTLRQKKKDGTTHYTLSPARKEHWQQQLDHIELVKLRRKYYLGEDA